MKRLLSVLLLATFSLSSARAQSSSDGTMQALLTEVRQLRVALERSMVLAPRIQVTLQRMQLQQDAVSRAAREVEDVRHQLAKSAAEEASVPAQIRDLEASALREQDPERRKAMENEVKAMKFLMEGRQAGDSQLRARESDIAGRLQAEQAKLDELNERLNSLERMLEAPPPKQP